MGCVCVYYTVCVAVMCVSKPDITMVGEVNEGCKGISDSAGFLWWNFR